MLMLGVLVGGMAVAVLAGLLVAVAMAARVGASVAAIVGSAIVVAVPFIGSGVAGAGYGSSVGTG
jgi:hypothetical protein